MNAAIRWLDEPLQASLSPGLRLRLYASCLALVLASVPFLHLYLEVDLTPVELAVHALDISLGTFAVLALLEVGTSLWQRSLQWRIATTRKVAAAFGAAGLAAVFALQALLHDSLPGTETIRHKHVDAGYGDMSLRVLPLVGLIGYLVVQGVRGQLLRLELEELRSLNERLARRGALEKLADSDERVCFRHDGRDVWIDAAAIRSIQAEENYCRLRVAGDGAAAPERSLLVRATLAETLARLPADGFAQVHRSHVVGLEHVSQVVRDGRRVELELSGGGRVPVSRSRVGELQGRLRDALAAGAMGAAGAAGAVGP